MHVSFKIYQRQSINGKFLAFIYKITQDIEYVYKSEHILQMLSYVFGAPKASGILSMEYLQIKLYICKAVKTA